jgi:hypothetical protein
MVTVDEVRRMSLLKKKRKKRRRMKPRALRAGCPFCWEWLPTPELQAEVFTASGCLGGRCECGAFFVIDETGRLGGVALMDLQALAAGGDLDRALTWREGENCEIKEKSLTAATPSFAGRTQEHDRSGPRVWALKVIANEEGR